jgi:hypothetical protein
VEEAGEIIALALLARGEELRSVATAVVASLSSSPACEMRER